MAGKTHYHVLAQDMANKLLQGEINSRDGREGQKLKKDRDHLEELVKERTLELTTAVEQLEREVTDRRRAEAKLRQRNRNLALLNRASQVLSATLDLDELLVTVLGEVRRSLGVVAGSVWLVDPGTNELVCLHATGPQSDDVRGWRLAPGDGIAGWVTRHGQSLIVPDVRADERHFGGVDQQTGLTVRSILSVPLRVKQNVIGVLQVVDSEVDRFSPMDQSLLESLAASAAIAIDNARLVKELRQHAAELETRNQELDAFAHTVAHDLKNPLGPIVGYAEVLKQDWKTLPDDELRQYLHIIAQSGRKMNNIIDALLLLARLRQVEDVEMSPLDMASIVAEAQRHLTLLIEEHRAEIVLPERWPAVLGYGPWVEAIWVNYISNAIKYGGQPPHVELGATILGNGSVRFWVRDDGPGLKPEEQARLFKPFERLDPQTPHAKGHGLGLSIVSRIVEKLGGQVGVESQVGRGSIFTFTLPANRQGGLATTVADNP